MTVTAESSFDDIRAAYRQLDAEISELERDFKAVVEPMRAELDRISNAALARLHAEKAKAWTGQDGGKIAVEVRTKFSVRSGAEFLKWVIENNQPGLVQSRCNSSAVKAYMEDAGALPPGIGEYTENVVKFS